MRNVYRQDKKVERFMKLKRYSWAGGTWFFMRRGGGAGKDEKRKVNKIEFNIQWESENCGISVINVVTK